MVPISELVPKNKFDEESLNKLRAALSNEINISPIIDKLFEWIQDINWPIAQDLCKMLATMKPDDIIPPIKMILNSDDECWKFSCICFLIPRLPAEVKKELIPDLSRIIAAPTDSEKLHETDADARDAYEDIIRSLS